MGDESTKESQWTKFAGFVDGWTNVRGYMSKPDRNTNTASIMTDEALDLMERVADELKARLDSIVQGPTNVVSRRMMLGTGDADNTMSIDGQNNVLINGASPP